MDLHLKDKVALVTGASSQTGYGKGIALTLAAEGCNLVLAGRNLEGLQKTAQEAQKSGIKVLTLSMDVKDRASIEAAVKSATEKFGRIDILVNNAGASSSNRPFMEMTDEDWDIDINVNLRGQMNMAKAVIPGMKSRGGGRIINISGGQGIPNISLYGAAKAGLVAFSHSLAAEVVQYGIIVNVLAPGLGDTGLTARASAAFKENYCRVSMLKRLCTPDDVGPAVAFLASDVCSYMTGQVMPLSTM